MNMDEMTPEVKQLLKDMELYYSDDEFDKLFVTNPSPKEDKEPDLGYKDALATPIIQVFSVVVETSFDNDTPCEIYGSIRAMEGQDTSFHLYDRESEDSETIWKHGTLSLIGPKDGVMLPFTGVTLDLCLRDRIREVEVIKGNVSFDSLIGEDNCFDKLMNVVIQCKHGSAYLYYAIFQFAIWGTLEVAITDLRDKESSSFSDIYGSLVASYGNSRRYCCTDDEFQYLESTIFKKPSDKPIHIMVGNPIELSRYVVVMPAYSSLKIEANLWDSSCKIVNDNIEIQARGRGEDTMYIKSQRASLQVKVRWWNAYQQLYKYRISKADTKVVEDIKQEEMQKKRRVIHDQPLLSSSSISGSLPTTACTSHSKCYGSFLTEVFSICIGGITEEIYALCGTIFLQDGLTKFYIYSKEASCFELLEDNNIVSTEGPDHVVTNCEFYLSLNLKDPIRDLEVSRGYFSWNIAQLGKDNMSWFNKRLCSIVRGKDGFAAVHYMIFENAFKAHVEVRFFSNSLAAANVYGHLIAYYRGCDYSKSYERKYYRSRLFDLPQSKSIELMTGSKITLSRSVVAVPTLSSLFIEADMEVCGLTGLCNSKKGSVFGTVEFEIDMSSCTRKEIKGENCWIELFVRFQK